MRCRCGFGMVRFALSNAVWYGMEWGSMIRGGMVRCGIIRYTCWYYSIGMSRYDVGTLPMKYNVGTVSVRFAAGTASVRYGTVRYGVIRYGLRYGTVLSHCHFFVATHYRYV